MISIDAFGKSAKLEKKEEKPEKSNVINFEGFADAKNVDN